LLLRNISAYLGNLLFRRDANVKICKKGVKPTGDSGNPNSLTMRSQRLYNDIMTSADDSTRGGWS
jgi:hypothetical protein